MSSAPDYYEPGYDFTDFQETNPDTPLPADELDIQLEAIATAINTTQDRLAEIQNDDGSLRAGIVGSAQLGGDLTIGIRPAVTWTSGTLYQENDTAYQGSNVYRCVVNHTSGVFATDLAAGNWVLVLDFEQYLDAAATSASQAEAAKDGAFFSASNAAAASTNAAAAESNFRSLYQVAGSAPSTRFNGTALQNGDLYSNTTTGKLFIRRAGAWEEAVDAINATFAHTYANGNGSATSFNVTYVPGKLEVYVNGTRQRVNPDSMTPGSNYDVGASNGTSVTFASAPSSGTRNIQFVAFGTFSVADIGDGSIDTDQLVDGAVTAAKCEPGAYWFVSGTGGAAEAVTLSPALTSLQNGALVRFESGGNESTTSGFISSLTSSGTTATVNYTAHGVAVGNIVRIVGANQAEYNGFVVVDSVINANSFTYKFAGSTTSPATGTLGLVAVVAGDGYPGGKTLNVNGLGAKPLRRQGGGRLLPGDIRAQSHVNASYDASLDAFTVDTCGGQFYSVICTSTGGSSYSVQAPTRIPTLNVPFLFPVRFLTANTVTAPTFTVTNAEDASSVAATVCRGGGRALRLGDIAAGEWALLQWAGAYWELLNPKNNGMAVAILQDQKASGTWGEATAAGIWQIRTLNTIVSDAHSMVSLNSNAFTLGPGTYLISWSVPAYAGEAVQSRLATAGTMVGLGSNAFTREGGHSDGEAVITITASTAYTIDCRVNSGYSLGGGYRVVFGTEVYTRVVIQRLA